MMHFLWVLAFDKIRRVTVAAKEGLQLLARNAGQHGRPRDFVAVEVEDRQHGSVANRVEEFVRVPTRGEGTGLRFTIAYDARNEKVGIVKGRAVGVGQ